jgi:hypothetical protein
MLFLIIPKSRVQDQKQPLAPQERKNVEKKAILIPVGSNMEYFALLDLSVIDNTV